MSGVFPSDEEWRVLQDMARFLNQFIAQEERPRYGYIDRLATPYSSKIIEITLQEALREARSANFWVPDVDCVRKFVELCNKNLRYATITSALALAYQRGGAKEA